MSEPKFKPGPWYLRTNRHPETDGRAWGWLDLYPPGSMKQSSPSGVNVTWTRGEISEANARLIAAAPDLLDALLRCKFDSLNMSFEDLRFCRAAIAKATGAAP